MGIVRPVMEQHPSAWVFFVIASPDRHERGHETGVDGSGEWCALVER